MNIIQRTHLTVEERTILSLFLVALSAGGYAVINIIATPGNINWQIVIYIALATTFATFGHTLATYLSTHGNLPLGTIIEAGTSVAEKKIEQAAPPAAKQQFVTLPPGTLVFPHGTPTLGADPTLPVVPPTVLPPSGETILPPQK